MKRRRLGPGSWWVPGMNTLKLARVRHPIPLGAVDVYLDGLVVVR